MRRPKRQGLHPFGLLQELGVGSPIPDYSKSVEDVYREATITSIEHDRTLEILFQAASDHRHPGLQSWVPDWSDTGWMGIDVRASMNIFCAFGSAHPTWNFSTNRQHLLLSGKLVDKLVYRTAILNVKESLWKLNGWQGNYGINEDTIRRGGVPSVLRDMHSCFKTFQELG